MTSLNYHTWFSCRSWFYIKFCFLIVNSFHTEHALRYLSKSVETTTASSCRRKTLLNNWKSWHDINTHYSLLRKLNVNTAKNTIKLKLKTVRSFKHCFLPSHNQTLQHWFKCWFPMDTNGWTEIRPHVQFFHQVINFCQLHFCEKIMFFSK